MPRIRLIILLVAVAALGFFLPALLHKSAPRPHSPAGTGASIDAAATADTLPGGAPAPVVPAGFAGTAQVVGKALMNKVRGQSNEMAAWAKAERQRIDTIEANVRDLELKIKDEDATGDDLMKQLDHMRAESLASSSQYESLQNTYNALVAERNQHVHEYEQKYAEYEAAVKNFDAKISDYDSRMRKALPMPAHP